MHTLIILENALTIGSRLGGALRCCAGEFGDRPDGFRYWRRHSGGVALLL
jgi:hypothetical protein